jgi:hypothetical protein
MDHVACSFSEPIQIVQPGSLSVKFKMGMWAKGGTTSFDNVAWSGFCGALLDALSHGCMTKVALIHLL